MRRALVLAAIAIICTVSPACQPGTGGLSEQDKAAIRKADEALSGTAFSENPNWTALAAELYAEDAELLPPDETRVAGLDAISAWYADWPRFKDFKIKEVRLEGSGRFAFRHISYIATPDVAGASGESTTSEGKDIAVLRKDANGKWMTVSECWNANASPSGIIVPTAAVAPNASTEVKRLSDIVGRWQMDGKFQMDPKAPAGPLSLALDCQWFAGGLQVVCLYSGTIAGAPFQETATYSYNPVTKAYAVYNVNSLGEAMLGKVTIDPATRVHVYDTYTGGKAAKLRLTLSNTTPAGGNWKEDIAVAGGAWTVLGEGKYVKAKSQ